MQAKSTHALPGRATNTNEVKSEGFRMTKTFLTVQQVTDKYKFLTLSAFRAMLYKDKELEKRCVRRIGKKMLICEEDFMEYINNLPSERVKKRKKDDSI